MSQISIVRVPSLSTKPRQILMVDGKPILCARGNQSMNDCVSYLMNGEPIPTDGNIKKALDRVKEVDHG